MEGKSLICNLCFFEIQKPSKENRWERRCLDCGNNDHHSFTYCEPEKVVVHWYCWNCDDYQNISIPPSSPFQSSTRLQVWKRSKEPGFLYKKEICNTKNCNSELEPFGERRHISKEDADAEELRLHRGDYDGA